MPFLIVSLLPGALPRYNMPLLAPAIWLLAIFIKEHALVWPKPLRKVITWTVVAVVAAMLIYSVAIIPFLESARKSARSPRSSTRRFRLTSRSTRSIPITSRTFFICIARSFTSRRAASCRRTARYILVRPAERQSALPAQRACVLPINDYRGQTNDPAEEWARGVDPLTGREKGEFVSTLTMPAIRSRNHRPAHPPDLPHLAATARPTPPPARPEPGEMADASRISRKAISRSASSPSASASRNRRSRAPSPAWRATAGSNAKARGTIAAARPSISQRKSSALWHRIEETARSPSPRIGGDDFPAQDLQTCLRVLNEIRRKALEVHRHPAQRHERQFHEKATARSRNDYRAEDEHRRARSGRRHRPESRTQRHLLDRRGRLARGRVFALSLFQRRETGDAATAAAAPGLGRQSDHERCAALSR